MELEFYKIHTCQNDVVLLNYLYNREPPAPEFYPLVSRHMCERHLGVGANGMVVLLRGEEHPVRMRFFLPSGEESERVNDALICLARFAFDSGVAGGERIAVECKEGVRTVDFIDSSHFRVALGRPRKLDGSAELREEPDREYTLAIEIDGKKEAVTPLFLQYHGAVLFYTELSEGRLKHLSRELRSSENFSHPVHPIFVQVFSKDELLMRTWFRKETVDYSSAAGIATVGAVLNGFAERDVIVHCNGQELFAQWTQGTNELFVTGSADYLFSGTFYYDETPPQSPAEGPL